MKKQFANNLHNKTFSNKFILFSVALIVFIVSIIACITVVGNTSSNQNSTTVTTEAADLTGPGNTEGWWIDEGRYSIDWFTNAESAVIDGVTYEAGTEQNPYIIKTAQDLAGLSWLVYTCGKSGNPLVSGTDYASYYTFQGKYFKQTKNIDLSAYYWQPIGIMYDHSGSTSKHYFSGCYDGGGHTVSGIFTRLGSTNAYSDQGLFGRVDAGGISITIKNIGIINSNIQGYIFVGGVVGYAYAGSSGTILITNCYNTGTVTSEEGSIVGGVVGYAYSYNFVSIQITNCYNTGKVTNVGGSSVGGVVGYAYTGTSGPILITNCYNAGSVEGSNNVGGVVGNAQSSGKIEITNCYNTGSVEGSNNVGGIVGDAYASSGANTITNCYYGVNCSQSIGGINGSDVSGQATYDSSITTKTPKTLSWYTTEANWNTAYPWDFDDVWTIDSSVNDGYPSFKIKWWIDEGNYSIDWFTNAKSVAIVGTVYEPGTEQNPYIIETAKDLAGLSWLVYTCGEENNPLVSGTDYSGSYTFQGKYFKQTANIDLSEYYWQPIGINYKRSGIISQHYFSGNYDGDSHTVSGVFTPSGSTNAYSYQGLFGRIHAYSTSDQLSIKDIGVTNSNMQGYDNVGGVVGYVAGAITLINCYNVGSVEGSSNVGGIVGYAYAYSSGTITITNCYNTGKVTGTKNYIGGTVGYAYASSGTLSLINCYNVGSVEGSGNIGGVVGNASASLGTLSLINCYNSGSVEGSSNIGGVGGYFSASSSCAVYIRKCANLGNIILTGASSYSGGIIACVSVSGSSGTLQVTNCYSEGTIFVQGASTTVGGFVGKAYANYSTYTNVYFEFCAVDMNVSTSGSGSISSQGAFYGGTNVITTKNSYSIFNGVKSLTSTVDEMDNNFAYILNFKDGKPLPLGLYAVSQFGEKSNIVDRINALQL